MTTPQPLPTPEPAIKWYKVQHIADVRYHRNDQSVDFNREPDYVPLKERLWVGWGGERTPNPQQAAVWDATEPWLGYFRGRPKKYRLIPHHTEPELA